MTEHKWKPGDVAMVTIPGRGETVAMYMDGGDWETPWAESDGQTTYAAAPTYGNGLPGHPLVVIDPESMEDVERLTNALDRFITSGDNYADGVQAALRKFAAPTPPKPDEPQGLGAVVEEGDGRKWTRVGTSPGLRNWCDDNAMDSEFKVYADIAAVRVLSEGVVA